ncbi:hypothetical protein GCM10020000_06030 [Streptomyces olivoverticillatus]
MPKPLSCTLWVAHSEPNSGLLTDSSPTSDASWGVVGVAARVEPQAGHRVGRLAVPVHVQLAGGRVEEEEPGHVALLRRQGREVAQEGAGQPVPGDHIGAAAEDVGRGVVHGVEEVLHRGAYALRAARARRLLAARSGQVVEVVPLGPAQPQRVGYRVEHCRGDVLSPALFEPGVVGHADPGDLGEFLAAQTRHAAAAAMRRQAHVLGPQPGAAGTEELAQFGALVHTHQYAGGVSGPRVVLPVVGTASVGSTEFWLRPPGPVMIDVMTHTTVHAYAAPAPKAPLERTTIERRALGEHDILIDIKFAGICHSDIHTVRGEWGHETFPIVPGHEIAGIVAEVGPGVTRYAPGDRVGVGCFVDSCRECDNCRSRPSAVLHRRVRPGRHVRCDRP